MACKETWELVKKYFRPDSKIDKWGDPNELSDSHLLRLYDFRTFVNCPIYVTAGVKTSGHEKGSYHYKKIDEHGGVLDPCATDIVIPDYEKSPFDLILDATRFGFTGLGYYPHWKFNGKTVGGLHVDSRPLKWDLDETINYSHSRWMGVLDEKGKQIYIPLTFHNLLKYQIDDKKIDGLH